MRIVVIGGSGHIGTFLVPRLVRAGHDVVSISRGSRPTTSTIQPGEQVRHVTADRAAEDREGTFPNTVAGLRTPTSSSTSSASPSTPRPRSSNGCAARPGTCCTAAPSGAGAPARAADHRGQRNRRPSASTASRRPPSPGCWRTRPVRWTGHHVPASGPHRRSRLAPDRPPRQPRPRRVAQAFSRTADRRSRDRRGVHAPCPRRRCGPGFEAAAIHRRTRRPAKTSTSSRPPR